MKFTQLFKESETNTDNFEEMYDKLTDLLINESTIKDNDGKSYDFDTFGEEYSDADNKEEFLKKFSNLLNNKSKNDKPSDEPNEDTDEKKKNITVNPDVYKFKDFNTFFGIDEHTFDDLEKYLGNGKEVALMFSTKNIDGAPFRGDKDEVIGYKTQGYFDILYYNKLLIIATAIELYNQKLKGIKESVTQKLDQMTGSQTRRNQNYLKYREELDGISGKIVSEAKKSGKTSVSVKWFGKDISVEVPNNIFVFLYAHIVGSMIANLEGKGNMQTSVKSHILDKGIYEALYKIATERVQDDDQAFRLDIIIDGFLMFVGGRELVRAKYPILKHSARIEIMSNSTTLFETNGKNLILDNIKEIGNKKEWSGFSIQSRVKTSGSKGRIKAFGATGDAIGLEPKDIFNKAESGDISKDETSRLEIGKFNNDKEFAISRQKSDPFAFVATDLNANMLNTSVSLTTAAFNELDLPANVRTSDVFGVRVLGDKDQLQEAKNILEQYEGSPDDTIVSFNGKDTRLLNIKKWVKATNIYQTTEINSIINRALQGDTSIYQAIGKDKEDTLESMLTDEDSVTNNNSTEKYDTLYKESYSPELMKQAFDQVSFAFQRDTNVLDALVKNFNSIGKGKEVDVRKGGGDTNGRIIFNLIYNNLMSIREVYYMLSRPFTTLKRSLNWSLSINNDKFRPKNQQINNPSRDRSEVNVSKLTNFDKVKDEVKEITNADLTSGLQVGISNKAIRDAIVDVLGTKAGRLFVLEGGYDSDGNSIAETGKQPMFDTFVARMSSLYNRNLELLNVMSSKVFADDAKTALAKGKMYNEPDIVLPQSLTEGENDGEFIVGGTNAPSFSKANTIGLGASSYTARAPVLKNGKLGVPSDGNSNVQFIKDWINSRDGQMFLKEHPNAHVYSNGYVNITDDSGKEIYRRKLINPYVNNDKDFGNTLIDSQTLAGKENKSVNKQVMWSTGYDNFNVDNDKSLSSENIDRIKSFISNPEKSNLDERPLVGVNQVSGEATNKFTGEKRNFKVPHVVDESKKIKFTDLFKI